MVAACVGKEIGRLVVASLAFVVLVVACGSPAQRAQPDEPGVVKPQGPKRIKAAIMSLPPTLSKSDVVAGAGTYPGGDALEELANAGLTHADHRGQRLPQLAEAVPTVENGLWKIFPDGRMETTWKLRQNAVWHDGVPVTSTDFLFTAQLSQGKDLPIFKGREFRSLDTIEVLDAGTILVKWKETYVGADESFLMVRPQHILEKAYVEDKPSVLSHPYWTHAYIGAGPYRVREWVEGSHVVLNAFDRYVLGRPKIDEITVKFIPDPKAMVVNILAGEVDLTFGRHISLQEAVQVREQWNGGKIEVGHANWIALYPQFINPSSQVLLNVQFRRALLHALDRKEIVDTIQFGESPVAHAFVSPGQAIYREVERSIVRYDYDPRQAVQLIQRLGYTQGGDRMFRDAAGQTIPLEVRTSGGDDAHEAGVLIVAEQLKRVGVAADPFLIPQARRRDLEYNQTFPGLRLWRKDNSPWAPARWHTRETPLPETRFVGSNDSRYQNPELDDLIDRYFATVSPRERLPLLGRILQHVTEQVTMLGLWYNTEPQAISNRVKGRTVKQTALANDAWNPEQWDVT